MTQIKRIDRLLADAESAATMKNMGLAFSSVRIIVDGKPVHPDDYVREITRLYRETWVLGPIREARALLKYGV